MFIRFIYLFLFILLLTHVSLADNDLSVDIKNPVNETVAYSSKQKAIMHLNFAKVYGVNKDWKNYYEHILSIYKYCPKLKSSKFYLIRSKNKIFLPEEIIDSEIINKLNKLGINNIFTKDDSINALEVIFPVLGSMCKN